eukprot:UN01958
MQFNFSSLPWVSNYFPPVVSAGFVGQVKPRGGS